MANRLLLHYKTPLPFNGLGTALLFLLMYGFTCVSCKVQVLEKVSAVLGKNITLGCRIELDSNLSLTQSSWERMLPSGTTTLAVFNPQFGISISQEYAGRVSFLSPSIHDATIVLEGVGFADIGSYTCKVATFPLGNSQASTTVNILVEPKVYVSAGSAPLLDGGNDTVVATCIAERGRPAAEVSWETELHGHEERRWQDEANGTSSSQVDYVWRPRRAEPGHTLTLTCVVRHPALRTEFRIPYVLSVQFAPEVSVAGKERSWFVGQEKVQLNCASRANPPAHHFSWTRMDGPMPDGVDAANSTLTFGRPLERNDSGVYRCEVMNDIGLRSQDIHFWVQDPPPTTASPTTSTSPFLETDATSTTAPGRRRSHFTSPTLASLPESSLGTVVGGAVGGVLFLVLLLVLGGACYMRQRRTFRGDYYTKQYLGPADMQKEAQMDVLQPHELTVYGDEGGKGSQELKPKPGGELIYPEYTSDHKDSVGDWGDGRHHGGGGFYPGEHHNNTHNNLHPSGPPVHTHSPAVTNGSPYLPEDCYDNGPEGDYVSHMDGSVISRREWYV